MKRFWPWRRGAKSRDSDDPHQLSLEWGTASASVKATLSTPAGGEADSPRAVASPSSPVVVPAPLATPVSARITRKRHAPAVEDSGEGRVAARLPVPRPLRDAVEAGRFGIAEDGRLIRPAPEEVRAITEQHAERLVELLVAAADAVPSATPAEQARLRDTFTAAVSDYARDFGERPARQLEAYVRRQAASEHSAPGRHR